MSKFWKYMFYDKVPVVVLIMCLIIGTALWKHTDHHNPTMDIPKWLPILIWAIPVAVYIHRLSGYKK